MLNPNYRRSIPEAVQKESLFSEDDLVVFDVLVDDTPSDKESRSVLGH